jgi:membrane-bound lytic murein transglycosylase
MSRLAILIALFALADPYPAVSDEAAAAEAEYRTIAALIASVAQLSDATFLRNGKSYPASTAARFLREKWQSRKSEVRSAEEFIDRIASFSSTTSKPYLIRFADGQQVSSAEYLRAELAKLRAKAP